jgi:quercetin dioxygenase-like cupin family protein
MEKFNEREKEFRSGNSGPKYFVTGPYWDGGILVFLPGQSLGEHYHQEVEETFYFIEGAPKMVANGTEYRVSPGDVFRLSIGDKHNIVNDTNSPIKAFFVKSPYNPKDKVSV